jgi:hypothetical protein
VIGRNGSVVAERSLDSIDAYPAGVLGDLLLLQGSGRIYTMDASGRVQPYAYGQIAATNGRFVLWSGCDDRARCTYRLGDETTADTGRTSLETGYLMTGGEFGGSTILAPDGATVLGAIIGEQGQVDLHIVDLATGSVLEADRSFAGTAVWSPDGSWLFRSSIAGIDAISVRTGRVVKIDIPGLFMTNQTGVLAVG